MMTIKWSIAALVYSCGMLLWRVTGQEVSSQCPEIRQVAPGEGQILSPGYPEGYQPGLSCSWTIRVEPTHRLYLYVNHVDLRPEQGNKCLDYLRATTADGHELFSLCGEDRFAVAAGTHQVTLVFHSGAGSTAPHKGFNITYLGHAPVSDPCQDYRTWRDDRGRLSTASRSRPPYRGHHGLYSSRLHPRGNPLWYRIVSPSGVDLATSCVRLRRCNTKFPIWLTNGIIPPADGQEHRIALSMTFRDVTGSCSRGAMSLRSRKYRAWVKNCGDYRVYRLPNAPRPDSGYCFGERRKCRRGSSSANGWEPGCRKTSTVAMTNTPTRLEETTRKTTTSNVTPEVPAQKTVQLRTTTQKSTTQSKTRQETPTQKATPQRLTRKADTTQRNTTPQSTTPKARATRRLSWTFNTTTRPGPITECPKWFLDYLCDRRKAKNPNYDCGRINPRRCM